MMRVRLALLDFDARSACLAVEPGGTEMDAAGVRATVTAALALDVHRVDVWIDPSLPAASNAAVRASLPQGRVRVMQGRPATPATGGNRAFELPAGPESAAAVWTFVACFDALDRAVTGAAALVALAQHTADIDAAMWARLRFVLHELAANTADHAMFGGCTPKIELRLDATRSSVQLVYRDNARPFATTSPPEVDIDGKIARGERRGLGLFMLNRMARKVHYQRNGAWNETTVMLAGSGGATQPTRSGAMEGFVLDQLPSQRPNTVILRPAGNLDSTSVHVVDAKLNALVGRSGVQIVVDMSSVPFVSSAGIGVFLGSVSQLRATGGDLVFVGMQPAVFEVFEIINLSSFFKIVSSLDELEAATPR